MNSSNGWDEWRQHVLIELERSRESDESLKNQQSELRDDIHKLHLEIAGLKTQAKSWGAVAGMIPGGVWVALQYLMDKK